MTLSLTIENYKNLPDGGPTSVTVSGRRGIDIGRDSSLDWTLPDPHRAISSKHCEIRYEDGGFVLHDVSLNGTFLNGAPSRMQGPHRLRNGDRLVIGEYIIAVKLDLADEEVASLPDIGAATGNSAHPERWSAPEPPPPIDPRELRPVPSRSHAPDFLDWGMDVFDPLGDEATGRGAKSPGNTGPAHTDHDMNWLPPPPPALVPEAPPPIPDPRRPVWDAIEPGDFSAPDGSFGQEAPWAPAPPPAAPSPLPAPSLAADAPPGPPSGPAVAGANFVSRFAQAAGLPPEAIAKQDPEELGELLGALLRIVAEELTQLLQARLAARRIAGSGSQTMIKAADNNPLKFSPTPNDALRLMLGPPTRSYLDAGRALRQSFQDLKQHQIDTLAAIQGAVKMLVEDLDPDAIERMAGNDRGLFAMASSRKAKLWDSYLARWKAKAHRHDDGLSGAFMLYFSHCYDQAAEGDRDKPDRLRRDPAQGK
jgi:type VI secretion system protein ImpI